LNWNGLDQWQQWVLAIGGSLAAAFIIWLLTKFFRSRKGRIRGVTVQQNASPVVTQTFQPVINIHPLPTAAHTTMEDEKKPLSLGKAENGDKSELLRPQLLIDFDGTESNIVHAEHMQGDKPVSMIYVRVRVKNEGSAIAKGCRVYLTELKEVYPGGSTHSTALDDSKVLAWAGWDFSPKDVPPGVVCYADVVRVSKHDRGWLFSIQGKLFAHQQNLKDYVGTYRFRVMVTAENAAVGPSCEFDVIYNGDWHSLRAMPVTNT
jgi:hypothetical protein